MGSRFKGDVEERGDIHHDPSVSTTRSQGFGVAASLLSVRGRLEEADSRATVSIVLIHVQKQGYVRRAQYIFVHICISNMNGD